MNIAHAASPNPAHQSARVDRQRRVGEMMHGASLANLWRPRPLKGHRHRGTASGQAGGISNTSLGGPHHAFVC
jgi:hypothetical protein